MSEAAEPHDVRRGYPDRRRSGVATALLALPLSLLVLGLFGPLLPAGGSPWA